MLSVYQHLYHRRDKSKIDTRWRAEEFAKNYNFNCWPPYRPPAYAPRTIHRVVNTKSNGNF